MSWNLTQEWLCRENQQMPGFPVKATGTGKTCPGRTVGTPGKGNRDAERAPHKPGESPALRGERWRDKLAATRSEDNEDGGLPTRSPTGVGAGGINCGRRYTGGELLGAGEVGAAVADLVIAGDDFDFDGTVAIGRAAGIGVVTEAVLRAQLAVNAIEDGAKVLSRVGIEHGAAGGVGHGFEGVFAGGVAATLVFHRADDDSVEQRVGAHRFLASGVEVGAAGGFAGIGDEDDDAAAVVAAALEGAGAKKDGIVNRGARAGRYPANGGLQSGNVVRKGGDLGDVFIKREHGERSEEHTS